MIVLDYSKNSKFFADGKSDITLNCNLGDIKCFTFSNNKRVVGILYDRAVILTDRGENFNFVPYMLINKLTSEIGVTSKRLTSEVRETLTSAYNAKVSLDNAMEARKRIEKQIYEAQSGITNAVKQLGRLATIASGSIDPVLIRQVAEKTEDYLKARDTKSNRYEWCSFDIRTETNTFEVTLTVCSEKYVRNKHYSFVAQEYDGTLYFEETKDAAEYIKRNASNVLAYVYTTLKCTPALNEVEIELDPCHISVGDKDSILISQSLRFSFKSAKAVEALLEIISV